MRSLNGKLFAAPAAFTAIARFFWLIGQSNDPYRFIYYTKEGEIDRAFETLDMSDEEIQQEIQAIRNDAATVGEEVPEMREVDREDIFY